MSAIGTAANTAKQYFTANPKALAAVLKRLGYDSLDSLLLAMKNNKLLTAMMAWDMGSAGLEIIEAIRNTNPDIIAKLESTNKLALNDNTSIDRVIDNVSEDSDLIVQVRRFNDECQLIDQACSVVGGWDRLMVLRNALSLTDQTYRYYLEQKGRR